MVSFQQLKNAKPELFTTAGERYAKWSQRLEQHAVDFGKQVTDHVRPDDVWSGPAAEKAIPHCDRLRSEILDNIDEIAGIGKELKRAGQEFAAAQHDLKNALAQADAAGLVIRRGEWPEDSLEELRENGWWNGEAGRLQVPPEGTQARADFKLWLEGPAGRVVGDPMEAFDDALETETGT